MFKINDKVKVALISIVLTGIVASKGTAIINSFKGNEPPKKTDTSIVSLEPNPFNDPSIFKDTIELYSTDMTDFNTISERALDNIDKSESSKEVQEKLDGYIQYYTDLYNTSVYNVAKQFLNEYLSYDYTTIDQQSNHGGTEYVSKEFESILSERFDSFKKNVIKNKDIFKPESYIVSSISKKDGTAVIVLYVKLVGSNKSGQYAEHTFKEMLSLQLIDGNWLVTGEARRAI